MGKYHAIHKPHFKYSYRDGYVLEHRYIIYIYLSIINNKPTYIEGFDIHHLNGNTKDNRIENLQLITHSEHMKLHKLDRTNVFCNICKGKINNQYWHNDINGFLCHICYMIIRYYIKKFNKL